MSHLSNINIFIGPLKGDIMDPMFLLPVTPEVITITDSSNLTRSRVIGIGEIIQIGSRNLKRFSITSFFPISYDTYTTEQNVSGLRVSEPNSPLDIIANRYLPSPLEWVDRFNSMRDIPLKIVISGINVNENYVMNNFQWSVIGGQGLDIEYNASFVQYKELSIRMVDFGSFGDPIQSSTYAPFIKGDAIYQVIPGDTWASIVQKTGVSAFAIMALNGISNTFFLRPGIILHVKPFIIPDIPEVTPPVVRPGI